MRPDRLLDAEAIAFIARTSTRADLPIDVLGLLRAVGAEFRSREIEPRVSSTRKRPAAEWLSERSRDVVVLYRAPDAPRWLLPRERFALAHELAHILVAKSTTWRPSTSVEYYHLEDVCQRVASEVLIPQRLLSSEAERLRPAALVASIRKIQRLCSVSFEASAKRVLAESCSSALAFAIRAKNSRGQPVHKVAWTAGANRLFSVNRGSHLKRESPWAELLARTGARRVEHMTAAGVEWAVMRSHLTEHRFLLWGRVATGERENGSCEQPEELYNQSQHPGSQLEFYPVLDID